MNIYIYNSIDYRHRLVLINKFSYSSKVNIQNNTSGKEMRIPFSLKRKCVYTRDKQRGGETENY